MYKLFSLLCSVCFVWSILAQPSLNQGRVLPSTFCDTISFEFIQGKMVIEAEIGNQPRKFILDTGAPCIISEELHREIDAQVSHQEKLKDAVGGVVQLDRIRLKSFKMGQLEFRNIPAFVMREQTSLLLKCWGVEGIIGSNALRNCILQIDLWAKQLILTNKLRQLDLAGDSPIPLLLDKKQSSPYIQISLGANQPILALFDTGDPEMFCASKEDSAIPLEKQIARLVNVGEGKRTMSITDSQQVQWFRLLTFDTLSIGVTHLLSVNSIPAEEQTRSSVGIGLGEYGVITIDYLHQQFYFQGYEGRTLIETEKFDIAHGVKIIPNEDHYIIGMVWNNSSAARLGLKRGTKIQRIEGVDFSKRTPTLDCELLMGKYLQGEVIKLEYLDEEGRLIAVSIGLE